MTGELHTFLSVSYHAPSVSAEHIVWRRKFEAMCEVYHASDVSQPVHQYQINTQENSGSSSNEVYVGGTYTMDMMESPTHNTVSTTLIHDEITGTPLTLLMVDFRELDFLRCQVRVLTQQVSLSVSVFVLVLAESLLVYSTESHSCGDQLAIVATKLITTRLKWREPRAKPTNWNLAFHSNAVARHRHAVSHPPHHEVFHCVEPHKPLAVASPKEARLTTNRVTQEIAITHPPLDVSKRHAVAVSVVQGQAPHHAERRTQTNENANLDCLRPNGHGDGCAQIPAAADDPVAAERLAQLPIVGQSLGRAPNTAPIDPRTRKRDKLRSCVNYGFDCVPLACHLFKKT
ncbi:hypothetical protein Pelo_17038 [Pelomyxa schiedti]|nr:hypothetical protein Pelo_17038 [Pelomyxa schiedti]